LGGVLQFHRAFGRRVAQTLGTGIIDPGAVDSGVIFGALVGAIVWNVTSWLLAFPTSSSHALIGGLLGAGVAHAGLSAVVWSGVIKTAFGIVLAPLCGFAVAVGFVIAVSWLSARSLPFAVDRRFRHLQLVSAALYSLGHGGNDAHGCHCDPALFQRSPERRLQRSALGCAP
jgi:PiT family inorganic phosphate transporter